LKKNHFGATLCGCGQPATANQNRFSVFAL